MTPETASAPLSPPPVTAEPASPGGRSPRLWLRLGMSLVGFGLLYWLGRSVDVAGLRAGFARIPLYAIAALLLAAVASTVLQGVRFWLLFPAGLGAMQHVWLNALVQAGNILLPVRGGELVRPLYLKRRNPDLALGAVIGWTVLDKIVEVSTAVPWVAGAGALRPAGLDGVRAVAWWLGVPAVVLVVVILAFQLRRAPEVAHGRPSARNVGLATFVSLVFWAANYLIFLCVVPDPPLALVMLVGVSFAGALPSLPAGIGTYEAAFVWIGEQAGWPRETLLAGALVSHGLQIAVTLVFGLVALWLTGPARERR